MSKIEFADKKPLTRDEVHQAAVAELRTNLFMQEDDLQENWEGAYAYYKVEAPGPDGVNTSDAKSSDVSDTIEWILPAVLKPLVESPDVVRFDPVHPEDEDQAALESDYVHHTFMKKCKGFLKLYVHIKDALLLKNSIFCTYWDEGITNQLEEYENVTEVGLANLMVPDDGSEVRLISSEERTEPVSDPITGSILMQPDPVNPETLVPVTQTLYDVKIRRFTPNGAPVVENCVPEMFKVRFNHDSLDLDDCRWCCYTMNKTRSELYAYGYDEDLIDEIPVSESSYSQINNSVRYAREDIERTANSLGGERNETGDPSQDMLEVSRVYMTLDTDGDGYEEKLLVILGGEEGDVLLDYYEVPENPFSASSPFIAGHKFYGYSLYDKLKELTDQKTDVLRKLTDNLDLQNNPRKKVLIGQANLTDLLTIQPGGLYRMEQIGAVEEMPSPDISRTSDMLLRYYDKVRAERTGADPNAQSIVDLMPEESMNSAVERVISMKEELVGLIIRVFAETGVRSMFLKLRNLMLRHMPRTELVQLRNKWAQVNPGNWIERTNTTIVVGLGTGDRIKKTQGLGMILGIQKELAQGGFLGPLVSAERINHTLSELIRVQGLGDPDDFILSPALLDPENVAKNPKRAEEAMRAHQMRQHQEQQQAQQAQAQQQAQQAQQQALLQAQQQIEQTRAETKRYETDSKAKSQVQQAILKQQEASQKARQEMQKLHQDMAKFMEEMRLKWAELASKEGIEDAKMAAGISGTLISEGIKAKAAQQKQETGDDD